MNTKDDITFIPNTRESCIISGCPNIYGKKLRHSNEEKLPIVTLTREPIARNISDFFTHIDVLPNETGEAFRMISEEYGFDIAVEEDLSELVDLFFARFQHDRALVCFDVEFRDFLGIDLYEGTFPTSKGYKIYDSPKVRVLLIRLENLDDCAVAAFKEFLDIDDLKLVKRNTTEEKGYAQLYERFKESIAFPESYLDAMYQSRYSKTFYDETERVKFYQRWQKNN